MDIQVDITHVFTQQSLGEKARETTSKDNESLGLLQGF